MQIAKLDALDLNALKLRTKAQHLQLGRRLYEYKNAEDHYWIKTQLSVQDSYYSEAFERELAFYRKAHRNSANLSFMLEHSILKLESIDPKFLFGNDSLILPHVPLCFELSPFDLSLDQVVDKLLKALSALEELHASGWIHGDLKKEHLGLLDHRVKLLDFEQCFQQFDLNRTGLNATPHYMAPELFQGQKKSEASDIYALGIVFLEWLTQQHLYEKNYQAWAILHCQALEIRLPQQFQCFYQLLNLMLAKHKEGRVTDFLHLKKRLIVDIV